MKKGFTTALDQESEIRAEFSDVLKSISEQPQIVEDQLKSLRNFPGRSCLQNPLSAYIIWVRVDSLIRKQSELYPDFFGGEEATESSSRPAHELATSSQAQREVREVLRKLGARLGSSVFLEPTGQNLDPRSSTASQIQREFVDAVQSRGPKNAGGFGSYLAQNQGTCLGILACLIFSQLRGLSNQVWSQSFSQAQFDIGRAFSTAQTLIHALNDRPTSKMLERALEADVELEKLNVFGRVQPPAQQLFDAYQTAVNNLLKGVNAITTLDRARLTDRSLETTAREIALEHESPTPGVAKEEQEAPPQPTPTISPAPISDTLFDSLQRMIDRGECAAIPITETHLIYADRKDGRILGPMGEGTSAVVFFGRRRSGVAGGNNQIGFAVRVPKLSTGNAIQNFENAETCYLEHAQAHSVFAHFSLGLPIDSGCLHRELKIDNIRHLNVDVLVGNDAPGNAEMLVALNMSPGLAPRVGVVSRSFIWPESLNLALLKSGSTHEAVYDQLSRLMLESRQKHGTKSAPDGLEMPKIVLVREHDTSSQDSDESGFSYIGRANVQDLYAKEKMSGWAFGVPFMVSDWLTTDLHRLMSGLVSSHGRPGDAELMIKHIREQPLNNWFSLCAFLCEGLDAIHTLTPESEPTRVHGDVRPANVMFTRGANFLQCRWIDIGSGSITARERRLNQTRRTSIFYAWERTEHVSEENDQVEFFTDTSGAAKRFNIRFLFRDDNLKQATPVNLRGDDSGTRGKLSLLLPGDRLVIGGEFIFRVKKLLDDYLEVDKAWEIASGQTPVETDIAKLFQQRGYKSISEFKILWQWGVASDIYGMGMIILFAFYMRGLYGLTQPDDGSRVLEPRASRVDVEEGFAKLLSAIRTDGFLGAFLRSLNVSPETKDAGGGPSDQVQFCKKSTLFKLRQEIVQYVRTQRNDGVQDNKDDVLSDDPQVKKLIDIVEELRVFAPELENVFFGVNSNPAVFTLLMYIVLSCLWRRDEIDRLSKSVVEGVEEVDFQPYCASRMTKVGPTGMIPSKVLLEDLQTIARHLGADPLSQKPYNSAQPVIESGGSNKQVTGNLFNVVRAQRGEIERLRSKAEAALSMMDELRLKGKSGQGGETWRLQAADFMSGMQLRETLRALQQKLSEMKIPADDDGDQVR
ncbi:hypothetical protein [Bradyrhizobium sp. LA7.1]|uniref:hypothetical protein n=1 Tax=Bradyrhizobium sp. LA7.1 TaxID=3156324 RepID=UPI0033954C7B